MRCTSRRWWSSLLGVGTALVVSTQASSNELSPSPDHAIRALLAEHGTDLRVKWDFNTGYPTHVFGRAMDLGARPVSDAEFVGLARSIFDRYPGLGGFDGSVLELDSVTRMDLERIGTTNKVGVILKQVVDGVPVFGGTVSVVFSEDGKVLSIQNDALPNVEEIDVIPGLSEGQAIEIAKNVFGHSVKEVQDSNLLIVANADRSGPVLAWNIDIASDETNHDLPIIERLSIDANSGDLVRRETRVHAIDLLVYGRLWATPGNKPDTTGNPEVLYDGQFVHHTSAVGSDHSDLLGDVVIPYGGTSNQVVTSSFGSSSLYCRVVTQSGSNITRTETVTPGVRREMRLNRGRFEKGTAQANSQRHVIIFREFLKSINGTGNPFNFQVRANPNITSTCNAYYNGSSINFYLAGGGCVNTAYTTVVAHEEGHWYNDLSGSGNGGDGFGEGNADTVAEYIYDTNLVGEDFCGPGCHVRNGENNRKYCGSCGAGCYGEVHVDGEVLMAAKWKVRKRLNTAYGDATGDLIADSLYVRWMDSYNDKTICTIIRDHWLVLDDNDGNLGNGTPNSAHIDGGFKDQGFPGYY